MNRFIVTIAALAFALSVPGIALAHGDHHRTLFGTITALNEGRMTVSTGDQKSEVAELGPSTSYVLVDGGEGKLSDLHEGMRVVIKLDPHDGVADEVDYASPQKRAVPKRQEHGHDHAHGERSP